MNQQRNRTVTENGKAPQNLSISPNDFEELLTTLQALAKRQKEADDNSKALQNVLEAVVEKLENLENQVNQLENSQKKPLNTLEKTIEGNHQALDGQLKDLKKAIGQELGSVKTEIQDKLSQYNSNFLVTWQEAQGDREQIKGLLEEKIDPPQMLKLGALILILSTLLNWGLVRLFPPNTNLIEQIKGRVNNIEIKLNRMEKPKGR
jgi:chromosome segregation ATPase